MGVVKILATQEYTHGYHMWKSIADNDCTRVIYKAHFQEAYLDREELKHTAGAAGYGLANNEKEGKMENSFIDFASATPARDTIFTELTTTHVNLSTKLRQQEDHI